LHTQRTGFIGTIPAAIGRLTGLSKIFIQDNGLTGTLPDFNSSSFAMGDWYMSKIAFPAAFSALN
jgi:hypothetical protein